MRPTDAIRHPGSGRPGRWLSTVPAVVLAGIAHTFSFAPFGWWWLQLLSLAVLAHATAHATARRAAGLGWWFAVGWLVSGFWWLYISMHDHGGLHPALAALGVVMLAALLGLYYAAAMALWARLRSGRGGWDTASWAACWLLAELARATVFTGFPWIASGYAHAEGPLAVWAPWIGIYGLCALAALVAGAIARGLQCRTLRSALVAAAAIGALTLGGPLLPHEFTRSAGTLRVSLLQPNIPQEIKFDPARLEAQLTGLVRQLARAQGALVVTPESVVPLTQSQLGEAYWGELRAALAAGARPGAPRAGLIGIFVGDDRSGYVNSVVSLEAVAPGDRTAAGRDEYRYGKRHLLPFGEVIPPGFHWFVELMDIPLADQERGLNTASFAFAGQRLRPLVCYEDLFGEDIVASVVGPEPATVFVNVSNLAWFGPWLVQDQHLQFSQMRALEFQRPVVRSTNTGATAVVDHRGRVTARLPALTEDILESSVEGRLGETPYARWLAALGLWPLSLIALVVCALAGRQRPVANRVRRPGP